MEDLEFRVWDKRISEWQNHLLKVNEDGCLFFSHPYVAPECYAIMQFTGMKNRNGEKVFEDDIVSLYHCGDFQYSGVVFWDKSQMTYKVKHPCDIQSQYDLSDWVGYEDEIETIGNIHENPELLEEK